MTTQDSSGDAAREARFRLLYERNYESVYAYVHRRLPGNAADVPDAVADIFTVAWRRLAAIPPAPDDRLWLFGVARNIVRRHERSRRRRDRLLGRLTSLPATPTTAAALDSRVQQALDAIDRADREVIRLVLWDGLTHHQTAQVLGCSPNAVAIRLHRAKLRLRHELHLEANPSPPPTAYGLTPDPRS